MATNTTISSLVPGMKSLALQFIIINKKDEPVVTNAGMHIYYFLVADQTGSIIYVHHGKEGAKMNIGDLMKIQDGIAILHKGRFQITLEKSCGKITRYGEDLMVA